MRRLLYLAALIATPAAAQISNPPIVSIDTSEFATKADMQAAQAAASTADSKATTAATTASSAQTAATNAANSASAAQTAASDAASVAAAAQSAAAAAQTAAASSVKSVNAATPNASGAVTLAIPTPSNTTPPSVADASSTGTMTTMYALANHTHASKARRVIATSAADGSYTFNYAANPFTNPPVCAAVAEVAAGVTDVVNVQIIGTPTTTNASFLVNRANRSVASLLGLTVLSIPAQPGPTKIHAICLEP